MTDKAERQKYVQTLKRTLTRDGQIIIATFAVDGPLKCSGLDVARYDAPSLCAELGEGFQLLEQMNETHVTPWGTEQKFSYFRFVPKQLLSSRHLRPPAARGMGGAAVGR